MRAAFIGCVQLSERVLRALLDSAALDVVGVATKARSSFNADFATLEPLARSRGLSCFIEAGNDQAGLLQWLGALQPDVVFCVGWPYLLNEQVLVLPRHGIIGYHPADLPRNRGRHPIIWALALGLAETASTYFRMVPAADAGPLIDKQAVRIGPDDDAAALYERLAGVAEQQIVAIARRLAKGRLDAVPQDLAAGNVWRKRGQRDGLIDWRMSSRSIHNLVRALARPYVGAHCEFRGQQVKVWRVRPMAWAAANLEPGKVLRADAGELIVKTGDGAVILQEHEFPVLPEGGEYI